MALRQLAAFRERPRTSTVEAMRSSSVLVRLLLLGLASVPPTGGLAAAADEPSGRLVGVVRDATGAGVPAARVEVRSAPAASVRSVLADARGRYAFDALPAGPYAVAASAPGFARVVRKDVPVSGNAESEADFVLELAPREAFVEVTARATERPLVIETDPRAPRQARRGRGGSGAGLSTLNCCSSTGSVESSATSIPPGALIAVWLVVVVLSAAPMPPPVGAKTRIWLPSESET